MKSIVITGSTSGIGLGLAAAFLNRGCAVTISGHSQMNLDKAYSILAGRFDSSRIQAYFCDVSHYDQVEGLSTHLSSHNIPRAYLLLPSGDILLE